MKTLAICVLTLCVFETAFASEERKRPRLIPQPHSQFYYANWDANADSTQDVSHLRTDQLNSWYADRTAPQSQPNEERQRLREQQLREQAASDKKAYDQYVKNGGRKTWTKKNIPGTQTFKKLYEGRVATPGTRPRHYVFYPHPPVSAQPSILIQNVFIQNYPSGTPPHFVQSEEPVGQPFAVAALPVAQTLIVEQPVPPMQEPVAMPHAPIVISSEEDSDEDFEEECPSLAELLESCLLENNENYKRDYETFFRTQS